MWCNLEIFLRVLNLRGRKFFDFGRYIFKVSIAVDRVNKLSACESSKEKGRLIFGVAVERRLRLFAWMLTHEALKLFKLLDLPLELEACFWRHWQFFFLADLQFIILETRRFKSRICALLFYQFWHRFVYLSIGENDRRWLKMITGRRQTWCQVVIQDTVQQALNLRKQYKSSIWECQIIALHQVLNRVFGATDIRVISLVLPQKLNNWIKKAYRVNLDQDWLCSAYMRCTWHQGDGT